MADSGGIRCPHCNKKLMETLRGKATIWCRTCKTMRFLVIDSIPVATS